MYVASYWHSHKIYQGCVLFLKIARSKCLGKYTAKKTCSESSFLWFIFPGADSLRPLNISNWWLCQVYYSCWSMVLPGVGLILLLLLLLLFLLIVGIIQLCPEFKKKKKYKGNSHKTPRTTTINKSSSTADPAANIKQTWAESHFPVVRTRGSTTWRQAPVCKRCLPLHLCFLCLLPSNNNLSNAIMYRNGRYLLKRYSYQIWHAETAQGSISC